MNRIFVSGSVAAKPRVSYTPRGQKIVTFPLRVEGGGFSIDVIVAGAPENEAYADLGKRVLVAGALAKMKTEAKDVIKVKASKILPMEE